MNQLEDLINAGLAELQAERAEQERAARAQELARQCQERDTDRAVLAAVVAALPPALTPYLDRQAEPVPEPASQSRRRYYLRPPACTSIWLYARRIGVEWGLSSVCVPDRNGEWHHYAEPVPWVRVVAMAYENAQVS